MTFVPLLNSVKFSARNQCAYFRKKDSRVYIVLEERIHDSDLSVTVFQKCITNFYFNVINVLYNNGNLLKKGIHNFNSATLTMSMLVKLVKYHLLSTLLLKIGNNLFQLGKKRALVLKKNLLYLNKKPLFSLGGTSKFKYPSK